MIGVMGCSPGMILNRRRVISAEELCVLLEPVAQFGGAAADRDGHERGAKDRRCHRVGKEVGTRPLAEQRDDLGPAAGVIPADAAQGFAQCAGEVGDDAIHREDAVGGDELEPGPAGLLKALGLPDISSPTALPHQPLKRNGGVADPQCPKADRRRRKPVCSRRRRSSSFPMAADRLSTQNDGTQQ